MPKELGDQWEAWDPDQALPDELPDELIQFYRSLFAQEMADWPEEIRELLIERHVSPEWLRVGFKRRRTSISSTMRCVTRDRCPTCR